MALVVAYGWLLALALGLAAVALASALLLARSPAAPARSPSWRIREGLSAAPHAALLAFAGWLALRAWATLRGWGPAETWLGVTSKAPRAPEPYLLTALATFAGLTVLAAIGLVAFAPQGAAARTAPRIGPFAVKAALASSLLAAASLLLPLGAPAHAAFVRIPPDVTTLLPMLALVAGCYAFRRERPAPPSNAKVAVAAPVAAKLSQADALSLARDAGLLGQTPRAIALAPGNTSQREAGAGSGVWRALAPDDWLLPAELQAFWNEPEMRVLVPDLPDASAERLIEAIAGGSALRGERTLALVREPRTSAVRLRAALARSRMSRPNAVVAGLIELEQARREQVCPSVVFVSLAELCALPARLLADPVLRPLAASERICAWLDETGRLSASDLCHFALALRALAGIRAAEGGLGGAWIFGDGTRGFRDWLATVLGAEVRIASIGWAAADSARQLWLGPSLQAARPADAPKQADAVSKRAPASAVTVDDRIGWFAGRDRAGAPNPDASLCWLWAAPADVVAAARRAAARPAHEPCLLVVSLMPGLVSSVLLDPEVAWVQDPPQRCFPTLGASSLIALAHLEALLGAGRLPQQALAWIYGEELVRTRIEERMPRPVRQPPRVVSALGSAETWQGNVWQVAGADQKSPYRPTVTAAHVTYVDGRERRAIRHVDRATAATRLPPHSVFVAGDTTYLVPGDARTDSGEVLLSVAPAGARPNQPLLHSQLAWKCWLEEPAMVQRQALRLALGRATVDVHESVSELVPLGQSRAQAIRIAPVEARFESRARVIYLEGVTSVDALEHLRAVLDEVLPLFVAGATGDVAVAVQPGGFGPIEGRPAIVLYDRFPRGVGLVEALDAEAIWLLLRWAREVVARCACAEGCTQCVPMHALARDKSGVLSALRSSQG